MPFVVQRWRANPLVLACCRLRTVRILANTTDSYLAMQQQKYQTRSVVPGCVCEPAARRAVCRAGGHAFGGKGWGGSGLIGRALGY
jgi:hypothetical protein